MECASTGINEPEGFLSIPQQFTLPAVEAKSSGTVLLENLDQFRGDVIHGFSLTQQPPVGWMRWLTQIVSSSLDWIESESMREEIWDLASRRIAELCGKTAAPQTTRHITLKSNDWQFQLVEPSLTNETLGLKTWGSSLMLAERIARGALSVPPDTRVLELGAGTGLCGLVLARVGCCVWATDLPEIVPNLLHNINLNRLASDRIKARELDWRDPVTFDNLADTPFAFDLIVLSDLLYSKEHPSLVTEVVSFYLERNENLQLCIQLPLRPYFEAEREELYDRISRLGFVRSQYEEEEGHDDFGPQTFVWSFWRLKGGTADSSDT